MKAGLLAKDKVIVEAGLRELVLPHRSLAQGGVALAAATANGTVGAMYRLTPEERNAALPKENRKNNASRFSGAIGDRSISPGSRKPTGMPSLNVCGTHYPIRAIYSS
jgi:hypothetical protein